MYDAINNILLGCDWQLFYTVNKTVEKKMRDVVSPSRRCESFINEKVAVESALAASAAGKRTLCLVSTEGLYEAVDVLASFALAGSVKSLIVAVGETEEEVTPLGPMTGLPLLVAENNGEFNSAVQFGSYISEKYGTPVVIQMTGLDDRNGAIKTGISMTRPEHRQAELPVHILPAERLELIRAEFELYEGNRAVSREKTGVITDRVSCLQFYDDEVSYLKISTVFPLPLNLIADFLSSLDYAFISETYPVMERQMTGNGKVKKGLAAIPHRGPKADEDFFGFHVVRDKLGSASSINMARGIKRVVPDRKLLAITFEDHFLHSGIPAFIDTLNSGCTYTILILSNTREDEIRRMLGEFGFHNCHSIEKISDVAPFAQMEELTVLFARGIG